MRYVLITAMLVFGLHTSSAQTSDGLSLRFNVSYGAAWLKGAIPALTLDSVIPNCNCPEYHEYRGDLVSPTIGLDLALLGIMHVGFDVGVQSHLVRGFTPGDTLLALLPNGTVFLSITEYEGSINLYDASTRLFVGIDLPSMFYFEVGSSALFNVTNKASSAARVITPFGAVWDEQLFPNQRRFEHGRAVMLYEHPLVDFPGVRFDIDASVGKSFVIGDLTIRLLATYRHGLKELTTLKTLRSSSLSGTLGFMYQL